MAKVVQFIIRIAALISLLSALAMLFGFRAYNFTALLIEVMMIFIWMTSEDDLKKVYLRLLSFIRTNIWRNR